MILAADIGSTWLKAALFSPDGWRFPVVSAPMTASKLKLVSRLA